MNEFTFVFINTMIYLKSPVYYYSSFNTREIYICMTSMMMLEITMEVSVNNNLPLKGRAQARHILDLLELWELSGIGR